MSETATMTMAAEKPPNEQLEIPQNPQVQTAIPEQKVTMERPLYNPPDEAKNIVNVGTARANIAPTPEKPEGTAGWRDEHARQTVLQQHIDFFDTDHDGVIWPLDTFWCFYALGFNILLSALAVFVVHGGLSYPTCSGRLPDPFFRIWTERIHKAKHGSDSGTYDTEGRFLPQKFEDWFCKYGKGKDGVKMMDIFDALKGQRVIADPIGWTAGFFEWMATYVLLWPQDGLMKKEDCRRVFDGSILYEISVDRTGTTNPRKQWTKTPPN